MPTIYPRDENTYFIDAENAAEMARLMHQDRLTTEGMGACSPNVPTFPASKISWISPVARADGRLMSLLNILISV